MADFKWTIVGGSQVRTSLLFDSFFTKSEKSKSLYCAGYYIIKFDKGWVKSFCPKLITIERYESRGPFKNDLEMRQELSRANR